MASTGTVFVTVVGTSVQVVKKISHQAVTKPIVIPWCLGDGFRDVFVERVVQELQLETLLRGGYPIYGGYGIVISPECPPSRMNYVEGDLTLWAVLSVLWLHLREGGYLLKYKDLRMSGQKLPPPVEMTLRKIVGPDKAIEVLEFFMQGHHYSIVSRLGAAMEVYAAGVSSGFDIMKTSFQGLLPWFRHLFGKCTHNIYQESDSAVQALIELNRSLETPARRQGQASLVSEGGPTKVNQGGTRGGRPTPGAVLPIGLDHVVPDTYDHFNGFLY